MIINSIFYYSFKRQCFTYSYFVIYNMQIPNGAPGLAVFAFFIFAFCSIFIFTGLSAGQYLLLIIAVPGIIGGIVILNTFRQIINPNGKKAIISVTGKSESKIMDRCELTEEEIREIYDLDNPYYNVNSSIHFLFIPIVFGLVVAFYALRNPQYSMNVLLGLTELIIVTLCAMLYIDLLIPGCRLPFYTPIYRDVGDFIPTEKYYPQQTVSNKFIEFPRGSSIQIIGALIGFVITAVIFIAARGIGPLFLLWAILPAFIMITLGYYSISSILPHGRYTTVYWSSSVSEIVKRSDLSDEVLMQIYRGNPRYMRKKPRDGVFVPCEFKPKTDAPNPNINEPKPKTDVPKPNTDVQMTWTEDRKPNTYEQRPKTEDPKSQSATSKYYKCPYCNYFNMKGAKRCVACRKKQP